MYIDYRIRVDERSPSNMIPAGRFEILNTEGMTHAIVVGAAAFVIALFSLIALAATPYGSVSFWVEIGVAAFGVACSILSMRKAVSDLNQNRSRELHTVKSREEYKDQVAKDKAVSYGFDLPRYVQERVASDDKPERDVASVDSSPAVYIFNGKKVSASVLREINAKAYRYACQDTVNDMQCLLMSRYQNEELGIRVTQVGHINSSPEELNTQYHLISETVDKKEHNKLEVSQLFQIADVSHVDRPLYIKAMMIIDFQLGNATVKWDSPQEVLSELIQVNEK
jgi:hypothetical protein